MLIYSFITDYQAFNLRYKDNTTRDKNETKVDKQSANLGKNNEPIQNRLSFLIDCKSVILHHLAILSFPMVRPAWDNWWFLSKKPSLMVSAIRIKRTFGLWDTKTRQMRDCNVASGAKTVVKCRKCACTELGRFVFCRAFGVGTTLSAYGVSARRKNRSQNHSETGFCV